jgi:hypothetical protein
MNADVEACDARSRSGMGSGYNLPRAYRRYPGYRIHLRFLVPLCSQKSRGAGISA